MSYLYRFTDVKDWVSCMKNYKIRITRLLLNFACKAPYLFPKDFRWIAENYNDKSDYIIKKKNDDAKVKTVSLIDSDFFWKSMSFTFFVSIDEIAKIKKWKSKMSLRMDDERISSMIDPRSFDKDLGWVNIGLVRIDSECFTDDLNSFYMNSLYLNFAYISLSKYPSGLYAITFYVSLKDTVTDLIKLVKLPKMTHFVELTSLNIFSRKNRGVVLFDEYKHARGIIKDNVDKVCKEAWLFLRLIMEDMGIKKERGEVYSVSDMYLDQMAPYFQSPSKSNDTDELFIIPKFRHFLNHALSENQDESFIFDSDINHEGVDMTYMRACPRITLSEHDFFRLGFCSNVESHLAIVPLLLIVKKIDMLSRAINGLGFHKKETSLIKLHKKLFSVIHELQLIDGWLKALEKDLAYHLIAGYKDKADNIIAYQKNRVSDLKLVMSNFQSLSENRIQISNITYNKIYSLVVFCFIVIQVVLAAMAIDWERKNVWYTPLVVWIKNNL